MINIALYVFFSFIYFNFEIIHKLPVYCFIDIKNRKNNNFARFLFLQQHKN